MKKTALIAAALAFVPGVAMAEDLPRIAVEIVDLDLATAAGQARLDDRVNTAIRIACRSGDRTIVSLRMERECASTMRKQAEGQVRLAIAAAHAERFAALDIDPGA